MDEVNKKPKVKKEVIKQDRVTLLPQTVTRIDSWISQVTEKVSGSISVNRSDLVNFFLDKQSDQLTKDQIEKIKAAYFDEVRYAQWALKQVKDAKKKGESLSLKDVFNLSRVLEANATKKPRKPKGTELKAATDENSSVDDSFFNHNDFKKS